MASLIVMAGGVASGKSTVARALAERLRLPRIEADAVRESLIEAGLGAAGPPGQASLEHEAGWLQSFEAGFEDRVYSELMQRAESAMAEGRGVILDACFPSRWWRGVARGLARRHGLPFLLVECRISPETRRRRLAERDRVAGTSGWEAISKRFAERFEPIEELRADEHVAVDSAREVSQSLVEVDAVLETLARPDASRFQPGGEPLRAVTFDCWNTLLFENDWTKAHARRVEAIRSALGRRGRAVTLAAAAAAFDHAWQRHMDQWRVGIASGARDVAYDALTTLGEPADRELLDDLTHAYQTASHSDQVFALSGARETLAALGRRGIACGLVCDTGLTPGRVVRSHLERLGLLEHLGIQIFSDEVGVPKPDARVFRAALEPLGVTADHAVHVGDLRRTDITGARAVGMRTIRITSRHDDVDPLPDADAVIRDHAALRDLLGIAR